MIEVKNLCKRYGPHVAVEDLSFTVEKGQIYGFLGPNGAGKSTTMNIMTGCLAATEGQVLIGGHDIYEEAEQAKKLIGYLPEQPPLYLDMTPEEYLIFVAKAKGVAKENISDQIYHAMAVTQIYDVKDRLIKHLSKGYRQRVGVAQAVVGNPEVIILDEPTVGLDPKQIIEIRDLIKKLGKDHTVILSSHILSEVRAVCDIIMIISHGKLVAIDTPENLEKMFSGDEVAIEVRVKASEAEARMVVGRIEEVRKASYTLEEGGEILNIRISYDGEDDAVSEKLFMGFSGIRRSVLGLTTHRATLEEIFLELTRGDSAPAAEKTEKEGGQD